MKLFLDMTFPPRSAKILRVMDQDVVHLIEAGFEPDTPDTKWMPEVAMKGWVAVTGDARIRTRKHERELWRSLKLTLFVLHKGFTNLGLWEQQIFLLKHWRAIDKRARRAKKGDIYKVSGSGKVEILESA